MISIVPVDVTISGSNLTRIASTLCAFFLVSITGCPPPDNTSGKKLTETQQLRDQIAEQQHLLKSKDEQLRAQAARIQALQDLGPERRMDDLVHVDRIAIDRLSGGYDANEDGKEDGIRVYLRLFDQYGGGIRAAGAVHVRVLDLWKESGERLLGEVDLTPQQMTPLWYGSFLTNHYTIDVPWKASDVRPARSEVTVIATFVDLLTGKSFEAQQSVKVAAPFPEAN